jgi:hypothetical protein
MRRAASEGALLLAPDGGDRQRTHGREFGPLEERRDSWRSRGGSQRPISPPRSSAATFAGAFPDARYEINRAIESGSSVALEGVYSATHTGALRMPGRAYWDVATVMAQLGLMPSAE